MMWSCSARCQGAAQVGVGHFAHTGAKSRAPAHHCRRRELSSTGALAEKKVHSSAGWGSQLGNHMVSDSRDPGGNMGTTYQVGAEGMCSHSWVITQHHSHLLHHKLGSNLLKSERKRTRRFVPTAMTLSHDYIPRWVHPRKTGRHICVSVRSWIWIQKANWKSKRW